jgi:hypothetical protein
MRYASRSDLHRAFCRYCGYPPMGPWRVRAHRVCTRGRRPRDPPSGARYPLRAPAGRSARPNPAHRVCDGGTQWTAGHQREPRPCRQSGIAEHDQARPRDSRRAAGFDRFINSEVALLRQMGGRGQPPDVFSSQAWGNPGGDRATAPTSPPSPFDSSLVHTTLPPLRGLPRARTGSLVAVREADQLRHGRAGRRSRARAEGGKRDRLHDRVREERRPTKPMLKAP